MITVEQQTTTRLGSRMHMKLHIDLSQGVIDVEGNHELVREVYADFRKKLLKGKECSLPSVPESTSKSKRETPSTPKRRRAKRKTVTADESGSSVNPDAPRMNKDLDTSGLLAFYEQFEAKNNPEKILIFLVFLTDKLEIPSPNTDDVYTCFDAAKQRLPKAFAQAFRDASGRRFGYIDYNSPTDLAVTTKGTNHFKFDLKKTSAE